MLACIIQPPNKKHGAASQHQALCRHEVPSKVLMVVQQRAEAYACTALDRRSICSCSSMLDLDLILPAVAACSLRPEAIGRTYYAWSGWYLRPTGPRYTAACCVLIGADYFLLRPFKAGSLNLEVCAFYAMGHGPLGIEVACRTGHTIRFIARP
jgi:hypothetical protein